MRKKKIDGSKGTEEARGESDERREVSVRGEGLE